MQDSTPPSSDDSPASLIEWVASLDAINGFIAVSAARSCAHHRQWARLQALVEAGFAINTPGESYQVDTHFGLSDKALLLHWFIEQEGMTTDFPQSLARLVDLGADPCLPNSRGFDALGHLCYTYQLDPRKMTNLPGACHALADRGIDLAAPCIQKGSVGSTIFNGARTAAELVRPANPSLADEILAIAQSRALAASTPRTSLRPLAPRL